MLTLSEIKQMNTTLLLGLIIHNKTLSSKTLHQIEKELKERGALI